MCDTTPESCARPHGHHERVRLINPRFPIREVTLRFPVDVAWRLLQLPGDPAPQCKSPLWPDPGASFSIRRGGRRWKDHRLGKGGGVVSFAVAVLGCSRIEAAEELIRRSGGHASIPAVYQYSTDPALRPLWLAPGCPPPPTRPAFEVSPCYTRVADHF